MQFLPELRSVMIPKIQGYGLKTFLDKDGETPLMMAAEFCAYETFLGKVDFNFLFQISPYFNPY